MAVSEERLEQPDLDAMFSRQSIAMKALNLMRKQPVGAAGFFIVAGLAVLAIFAEFISPYDPELIKWEDMLTGPGAEYWFGTDQFGRDILTRLICAPHSQLASSLHFRERPWPHPRYRQCLFRW